jgi:hypothetical protein
MEQDDKKRKALQPLNGGGPTQAAIHPNGTGSIYRPKVDDGYILIVAYSGEKASKIIPKNALFAIFAGFPVPRL